MKDNQINRDVTLTTMDWMMTNLEKKNGTASAAPAKKTASTKTKAAKKPKSTAKKEK